MLKRAVSGFLIAGLAWFSVASHAGATLVPEKSVISFVSVKNISIAEVHHFPGLSGSISDDGLVTVTVPLAQVETNIPIRNERMQKLFFDVAAFPDATIEATIDQQAVAAIANGSSAQMEVLFALKLHGKSQMLKSDVRVSRLGGEIQVNTLKPLIINAASFALTDGVERLREIAGLQNISAAVPVTASLTFRE